MHYRKGGVDAFKRKRTLEIDVEVLEDTAEGREQLEEMKKSKAESKQSSADRSYQ